MQTGMLLLIQAIYHDMDSRALFSSGLTRERNRVPGAAPWLTARRAQTRSILHQSLNCFFLRDLGDETDPFCPLTGAEMVGGELVMERPFERPMLMVVAASAGALAPGMTPQAAVGAGDPPPCGGSVRESLK
jgi:hypothetical protein